MKNATINFVQKKFLVGIRKFTIENKKILKIFVKERGTIGEYEVELSILDPSTTRNKQSARTKYINFGILFICLSFLFYKAITKEVEFAFIAMFLGVAILIPIAYYIWINSRKSFDWLRFHNRYTGEPIVYFHYNNPNEIEFSKFINKLKSLIKSQEPKEEKTIEQTEDSVVNQIKEFAKLLDEGLISEEEFNNSKKKLLDQLGSSERKIGF